LAQERKFYWVTLIPAVFMTAVIITYLLFAPEGFSLSNELSSTVGVLAAVLACIAFFIYRKKYLGK
ncbi:MAG: carbon starvation protein A, partial [Sedimentibacter sp.]